MKGLYNDKWYTQLASTLVRATDEADDEITNLVIAALAGIGIKSMVHFDTHGGKNLISFDMSAHPSDEDSAFITAINIELNRKASVAYRTKRLAAVLRTHLEPRKRHEIITSVAMDIMRIIRHSPETDDDDILATAAQKMTQLCEKLELPIVRIFATWHKENIRFEMSFKESFPEGISFMAYINTYARRSYARHKRTKADLVKLLDAVAP